MHTHAHITSRVHPQVAVATALGVAVAQRALLPEDLADCMLPFALTRVRERQGTEEVRTFCHRIL